MIFSVLCYLLSCRSMLSVYYFLYIILNYKFGWLHTYISKYLNNIYSSHTFCNQPCLIFLLYSKSIILYSIKIYEMILSSVNQFLSYAFFHFSFKTKLISKSILRNVSLFFTVFIKNIFTYILVCSYRNTPAIHLPFITIIELFFAICLLHKSNFLLQYY